MSPHRDFPELPPPSWLDRTLLCCAVAGLLAAVLLAALAAAGVW